MYHGNGCRVGGAALYKLRAHECRVTVERRKRLVEKVEVGFYRKSTDDRNAGLHTAGKLDGELVLVPAESCLAQQRTCGVKPFTAITGDEIDVLCRREPRQQRRLLK